MKSSREMTNDSGASNAGMVVTVRGSVVDMRFNTQLPPIYSLLRAGKNNQIVI
jgi:F-type H+-transporting ATPase subunit beta